MLPRSSSRSGLLSRVAVSSLRYNAALLAVLALATLCISALLLNAPGRAAPNHPPALHLASQVTPMRGPAGAGTRLPGTSIRGTSSSGRGPARRSTPAASIERPTHPGSRQQCPAGLLRPSSRRRCRPDSSCPTRPAGDTSATSRRRRHANGAGGTTGSRAAAAAPGAAPGAGSC
jgi:hypothetical protein